MSFVYYVVDGDEILVSTMRERAKAKAVARDPKVSLCVLDGQWPPTYLQVYCDASIDERFEHVVDVMMRIGVVMAGRPLDDSVRPLVEEAHDVKTASCCAYGRTRPSRHRRAMSIPKRTSRTSPMRSAPRCPGTVDHASPDPPRTRASNDDRRRTNE